MYQTSVRDRRPGVELAGSTDRSENRLPSTHKLSWKVVLVANVTFVMIVGMAEFTYVSIRVSDERATLLDHSSAADPALVVGYSTKKRLICISLIPMIGVLMAYVGQFCTSNVLRLVLGVVIGIAVILSVGTWMFYSPATSSIVKPSPQADR